MTSTYSNPIDVIDHDGLPQAVVVTTAFAVNEGDLVFWDNTNFTARPLTATTDVETSEASNHSKGLIGVAVGANKPEVYGGDEPMASIPVISKATVWLNSTAGQEYSHFQEVTVGADAQTITTAGVTANNRVGWVIVDPPAAARASQATPVSEKVGGAAQVRVRVLLDPKFAPAKVI